MWTKSKEIRIAFMLGVASTSPAHATQCIGTHPETHVLAPASAALPSDGGIVIGTTSVTGLGKAGTKPSAWTARIDGRPATVAPSVLAPGLVVYGAPAPTGARAGSIEVFEGAKSRARARLTGAYRPELAAPLLKAVIHAFLPEAVGTTTTVELSAPAPAGAIALVLYDAKGRARTWGPVTSGATKIVVYDDTMCASVPAGTIEPSPGDEVDVVWIDAAGRPSPHSAAVAVVRAPV